MRPMEARRHTHDGSAAGHRWASCLDAPAIPAAAAPMAVARQLRSRPALLDYPWAVSFQQTYQAVLDMTPPLPCLTMISCARMPDALVQQLQELDARQQQLRIMQQASLHRWHLCDQFSLLHIMQQATSRPSVSTVPCS